MDHRYVTWPFLLAAILATPLSGQDTEPEAPARTQRQSLAPQGTESITEEALLKHISVLASDDFEGRRSGTEGADMGAAYLIQQFQSLKLEPKGTKSYRQPFKKGKRSLANVVAVLPGWDEKLAREYVVIGAHFDHLGERKDRIYNGADDNASGCAAMLEIARAFTLAGKPRRSILFVGFDGEEIGLLGSKYFVKSPTVPRKRIVAMINLDMVGRGVTSDVRVCGTPHSDLLKEIVEAQAKEVDLSVHYDYEKEWRRASDHGPFGDDKIPFLYFGVLDHEDYHKPSDTVEKINGPKIERIARLGFLSAREVADSKKAPRWKK